jgi:hypothetical protein
MLLHLYFRQFPFEVLGEFTSMKYFALIDSGVKLLPASIPWPATVEQIVLPQNSKLRTIEPFSISEALGLKQLALTGSGDDLTIQSNGLHTKSVIMPNELYLSSNNQQWGVTLKLEQNAFGNVDGGALWTTMDMPTTDFPEGAFRLLLKTHFDKGHHGNLLVNYFLMMD